MKGDQGTVKKLIERIFCFLCVLALAFGADNCVTVVPFIICAEDLAGMTLQNDVVFLAVKKICELERVNIVDIKIEALGFDLGNYVLGCTNGVIRGIVDRGKEYVIILRRREKNRIFILRIERRVACGDRRALFKTADAVLFGA